MMRTASPAATTGTVMSASTAIEFSTAVLHRKQRSFAALSLFFYDIVTPQTEIFESL